MPQREVPNEICVIISICRASPRMLKRQTLGIIAQFAIPAIEPDLKEFPRGRDGGPSEAFVEVPGAAAGAPFCESVMIHAAISQAFLIPANSSTTSATAMTSVPSHECPTIIILEEITRK